MTELSHSVISPMSFRLEYKRGSTGPTMFQRYVRIQVDVNPICKQGDVADLLFAITFTLLSGELSYGACFFNFLLTDGSFCWRQHSSLPSDMRAHSGASLLKTISVCHEQSTQPEANYCAATANASTDEHVIELCRCISGKYFVRIGRLQWSLELSWASERHRERGGDVFRLQYDDGKAASLVSLVEQEQRRWVVAIMYGHQIR